MFNDRCCLSLRQASSAVLSLAEFTPLDNLYCSFFKEGVSNGVNVDIIFMIFWIIDPSISLRATKNDKNYIFTIFGRFLRKSGDFA
jgi:hypothetical protein